MIMQYPAHMIDTAWHDGASALAYAAARSNGEWTGDQLKMMLMRGELLLIGSGDLWAAVQHVQHPNKRVLHIYAVACTGDGNGINEPDITELAEYAKNTGCTGMTCAADSVAERLYSRYGFIHQYTIMERKL